MIDKMTMQQRMILATVFSFVFFIGYDYFFIPKKQLTQEQNSTMQVQKKSQNQSLELDSRSEAIMPSATNSTNKAYISTVKGKHYELKIDSLGRVSKFYLNDGKYMQDGKRIQLINENSTSLPLEIRFKDSSINELAFKSAYQADKELIELNGAEQSLILTQNLPNLIVIKTIKFRPDGSYDVKISLSKNEEYFLSPGARPNVIADSYTFHGVLVKQADDTMKVVEDGDAKGNESFLNSKILAAADRYYVTLFYNIQKGFESIISQRGDESEVFIRGEKNLELSGYIGPKEYKTLANINKSLTDVIEYGFITLIAKPMFTFLSYLYGFFGNWGWAIVAMTIIIRLVLFPLTYKGMVSMNKLKDIAPKVKEIQVKYKGDPQKMNMHVMELYKKHGANPMGGCLPIVMQIPIFFAIYRVLLNAIELKAAPWILWINDLSVMDPFFVLPIAMGITMYLQQRITPTTITDPMQEKIMKYLPLIFTFFFVTFPAGLTLYWFINNLFSMAQQFYVNHLFAKEKEEKKV